MENYRYELVESYFEKLNLDRPIRQYFKGRTVLVTGGAGAIGSNLSIALSQLVGSDGMVIILDNLSAIKTDQPIDLPGLDNILFVKGDIRSDVDLKRVFRENLQLFFI